MFYESLLIRWSNYGKMYLYDIIEKKRDGGILTKEEIEYAYTQVDEKLIEVIRKAKEKNISVQDVIALINLQVTIWIS